MTEEAVHLFRNSETKAIQPKTKRRKTELWYANINI